MPTALERAIEQLSDPSVALPDALRSLLVVARRIKAADLADWILHELEGYGDQAELPPYRFPEGVPIRLEFVGPGGVSRVAMLSRLELPEPLRGTGDSLQLRMPLGELRALAIGASNPRRALPVFWIEHYRQYAAKGEVPQYSMMQLNDASIEFPLTHLQGVLDRIRTVALDLALNIEDVSPQVGNPGGLNVDESTELANVVRVGLIQLFQGDAVITVAEHANIALGDGATAVQVVPGDIASLLAAAANYLDEDGIRALSDALHADGNAPGPETKGFLEKVKSGFYTLAGNMAASGAYDGLLALIAQAFPT